MYGKQRPLKLLILIGCILLGLPLNQLNAQDSKPSQFAQYINPMIGTDISDRFTMWGNYGGTYPGAVCPWGMVQLTPETSKRPSESGYYYKDDSILFFTCHTHHSGYPSGSNGRMQVSFWPTDEVTADLLKAGRRFSHQEEEAEAGYYRVRFEEGDQAEMTVTPHNGLFRYVSEALHTTLLITDAGKLCMKDAQTLTATSKHAIIRFNRPVDRYTIQQDTARLYFTQKDTQNGLVVGMSFSEHSFEKSQANADAEINANAEKKPDAETNADAQMKPDAKIKEWNFDTIRKQAFDSWEHELQGIQVVGVEGDETEEKMKFYTALYHACLMPTLLSDVNDTIYQHDLFSPWDTFRSLHPMLSLLKPQRQYELTQDLLHRYAVTGKLPKGSMTGFHVISILLDSWLKGTIQATPQQLLEMCERHVQDYEHLPALQAYLKNGYIDASMELSVSITTELAYNDWLLSRLATLAGDAEKAAKYEKRATSYQHLFDTSTGFMLPREGNEFLRAAGELGFQESTQWTASYFVPHNVQDLINRCGGDERFASRLAEAFDTDKILFDNEPVFHYPYLFTWANRPDLTTHYVHQILHHQYLTTPGGITGNDDLGSMSSWYVLSAIGLYPACPGSGEYLLSVPLFNEVTLPINKHQLSIRIKGVQREGVIPTIWMNGQKLNRWFISYEELSQCQSLVYDYTQPNMLREQLEKPYSLTKGASDFQPTCSPIVQKGECKPYLMVSGEEQNLPLSVVNRGETGVYVAQLKESGRIIAEKRMLIPQGEQCNDSLVFTLYAEGKHELTFEGQSFTLDVTDNQAKQPMVCLQLDAPSLSRQSDTLRISLQLQNRSGKRRTSILPIQVNQEEVAQLEASLNPGECQTYLVELPHLSEGMKKVEVLGMHHLVKIYSQPQDACLVDLHCGNIPTGNATDHSGFGNDATAHGAIVWGKDYLETNHQAYLSLPLSKSLMTPNQQVTLLTWIAPQERPNGNADFFTQGDYCCFKMDDPHTLVFFTGGWGRGECKVTVPDDWYTDWHLIAGICTGPTLQIYIDGELKKEITVSGQLAANKAPWNIGRNAEIPYSRFWRARFNRMRIYGTALTATDVREIYEKERATINKGN